MKSPFLTRRSVIESYELIEMRIELGKRKSTHSEEKTKDLAEMSKVKGKVSVVMSCQ